MKKNKLIHVGTFGQPNGLKGEIKIHILTSSLESFKNLNKYFIGEKLSKVNFKSFRFVGKKIIVSVDDYINRNEVKKLSGKKIFSLREYFPKIKNNEYYVNDLLECEVYNLEKKFLGTVINVENFGAGDLLEIKNNNKKFLIPINKENIKEINIIKNFIKIDPIPGVLE